MNPKGAPKYPKLYASVQALSPISPEAYASWLDTAQPMRFKKGQLLLAPGSILRRTYYVLEGASIAFALDQQGNEHIIQFAIEDWWISDLGSFLTGRPALLQVEAIEDCVVLCFQQEELEKQFKLHPELQTYYLKLTQRAFLSFQERTLDNLSLDAETRYQKFAAKYPGLELRLAQKYVASYLGMSAEFLSKIKKRLRR
jgi:CRP-like cAMP-binding protein